MRTFLAWIHRLDELVFVSLPWRPGATFLVYRSGWARLRQIALAVAAAGWYVGAFIGRLDAGFTMSVGGLLVLAFLLGAKPRRIRLMDRLLIEAASRAAIQLGTERKPGFWRIRGPVAGALGRDLRRLNQLPWPLPTGADLAVAREEQVIAASGAELRAFLQPILTAHVGYEPTGIEAQPGQAESAEPGQQWPVLRPDSTQ